MKHERGVPPPVCNCQRIKEGTHVGGVFPFKKMTMIAKVSQKIFSAVGRVQEGGGPKRWKGGGW